MSTPPLRANGVRYGISDNTIFVTAYGAKGDGVTDDTAAIQAAYAASVAGDKVVWPAGTYLITDTITISNGYIYTHGDGPQATIIKFDPASAKVCLKVSAGASAIVSGCITGIRFISTGANTQTKTAIQLNDTSGFLVEDVWVDPTNSSTWTGTTSVGLHLKGRELTRVNRYRAFCDLPILVDVNPNSTVGLDHFHGSDVYIRPTPSSGNACFKIVDNSVIVTNMRWSGTNAFIVDKYGVYWVDTTSSTISQNVSFVGVRCEQAVDATGTSYYIDHAQGIYNLVLDNCHAAAAQNGALLKGITNCTIKHGNFQASSGALSHITVDRMKDFKVINTFWQTGATATLTGLTQIEGTPLTQASQAMPSDGFWVDTASTLTRAQTITPTVSAIKTVLRHLDAANTNPWSFRTTNSFGGSNEMWGLYNVDVLKFKIDGNGNATTVGGSIDASGSMFVGGFAATSLTLGRTGQTIANAGIMTAALPARANNTIASANTIAPTALITHITGTTVLKTITPPTNLAQTNGGGVIHLIFDGVCTWDATGNILVGGTNTTAGTHVTFLWDNATTKWYPNRIA